MKKQPVATKELIFSTLRSKAEQMLVRENAAKAILLNNEAAVLLNELENYELELEMQNDELKASHYALELERLKFAGLFNSAPAGYLILNTNALIVEINEIGQNMLASTFGALTGQNLASFIHLEDRHNFNINNRTIQQYQQFSNADNLTIPKIQQCYFPFPEVSVKFLALSLMYFI